MKKIIGICFWAFILTASGNEQNRFKIFEDKNVSCKKKYEIAINTKSINEKDVKYLINLLSQNPRDYSSYAALISLTKMQNRKDLKLKVIGEGLLKRDNRYYALALGAMNNKEGIPYLRKALKQTKYNYVKHDCFLALRSLGAKLEDVDKLPPPNESKRLSIKLESEEQDIYPNQKPIFKLIFKNKSDKPLRLDLSIFDKFKLSSPEREIIIERKKIIPSLKESEQINDLFPIVNPREEYVKYYEFTFKIANLNVPNWPDGQKKERLLFLDIGNALGYELCIYEKDKIYPVDFVYVYSSKYGNARFKNNLNFLKETKPEEYEKYKKNSKIAVYDKKTVSNTVEIRFHSEPKK